MKIGKIVERYQELHDKVIDALEGEFEMDESIAIIEEYIEFVNRDVS